MDKSVRLNKYLAECGVASRRKADELIDEGLVKVNGRVTYELGVKVIPGKDKVMVKGKLVRPEAEKVYIAFHKPEQVLTSTDDPTDRQTVMDFFPKLKVRVFPVGRLDWDSEGLLLLTNDGDFSQQVLHPKSDLPKTYMVKVDGQVKDGQLRKLLSGVTIPGGRARAIEAKRVARKEASKKYDWIQVTITEGRNRQIRKMFTKLGFDVKKLRRISIGMLKLGSLKKGEHRFLTEKEVAKALRVPEVQSSMEEKRRVASRSIRAKKESQLKSKKKLFQGSKKSE